MTIRLYLLLQFVALVCALVLTVDAFWNGIVSADWTTVPHLVMEGAPPSRVTLLKFDRNNPSGENLQEWRNFAQLVGTRGDTRPGAAPGGPASSGGMLESLYEKQPIGDGYSKQVKAIKMLAKRESDRAEELKRRNPRGNHLLLVEVNAQHEEWPDDKAFFNLDFVTKFLGGNNPYMGDYYTFQPLLHLVMKRAAIQSAPQSILEQIQFTETMKVEPQNGGDDCGAVDPTTTQPEEQVSSATSALGILNISTSKVCPFFIFSQLHIMWFVQSYAPGVVSTDLPLKGTVPELDELAEDFIHPPVVSSDDEGDTSLAVLTKKQGTVLKRAKKIAKSQDNLEAKNRADVYVEVMELCMQAALGKKKKKKGPSSSSRRKRKPAEEDESSSTLHPDKSEKLPPAVLVERGMKALEREKSFVLRSLYPTGPTAVIRQISKGKPYQAAVDDSNSAAKSNQKKSSQRDGQGSGSSSSAGSSGLGLGAQGSARAELYHRMNVLSRFKIIL